MYQIMLLKERHSQGQEEGVEDACIYSPFLMHSLLIHKECAERADAAAQAAAIATDNRVHELLGRHAVTHSHHS